MKTFRDSTGREWVISITVDTVKRVRASCDVDLLGALGGDVLQRLITDPVLLCDVIYTCCEREANDRGITDVQFGEALAGDVIDHATTALLEALADFFPAGKRQVLQKALQKIGRLQAVALEKASELIDSPDLDARIQSILNGPGDSSTSSPEPQDSTPAP